MKRSAANIVREYGPFPDVSAVHGVSYDGTNIWIATGDTLNAVDPDSGKTVRTLNVPAHAGTAFDGQHLFQISGESHPEGRPEHGRCHRHDPTPDGGASGMAWAEGALWVGQYRNRKIHQVDPQTGAIYAHHRVRTASSPASPGSATNSGTAPGKLIKANCAASIPKSGEVLEQIDMPPGISVSGLEFERRRHVLLRWWRQRQSESRPQAQVRLRRQVGSPRAIVEHSRRSSDCGHPRGRNRISWHRRASMSASVIGGWQNVG